MNDNQLLGKAVATLADVAAAMAGNIHTLHLNFQGPEFDTFHKKVLKKYYEECDNDYDDLAEWARCYDYIAENKNESAKRIEFNSFNGTCTRQDTINQLDDWLTAMLDKYRDVFNIMNNIEDCAISIGLANWLQTRIEYWAKEVYFFNKNRLVEEKE